MHVKKLIFLLTFLTSTFAYTSFVQADGDHSNHSDISNAITNFQGNGQQQSTGGNSHSEMNHDDNHEEQTNNHSDDHSTSAQSEQHLGHTDSGHGVEGHGSESVIEETPPNFKVLGTFGFINLGFLSLGIILRIRKRKEIPYAVK